MKKQVIIALLICCIMPLYAQSVSSIEEKINKYLLTIQDKPALLRQFFSKMPKGGDLHHHTSGSIYAEDLIEIALQKDIFIDLQTFETYSEPEENPMAIPIHKAIMEGYRDRIIDAWSARNHDQAYSKSSSHDQFFDSFGKYGTILDDKEAVGLAHIRKYASLENVLYIETSLSVSVINRRIVKTAKEYTWDTEKSDYDNFERLYNHLVEHGLLGLARSVGDSIQLWDDNAKKLYPNSEVEIRYQIASTRIIDKIAVFARLALAHEAEKQSDLIVGVNFVAPEDNEVALRDYSLHMAMFSFFREKYPQVRLALHAGELTLGLVAPQQLRFHIKDAIQIGKANRIGHGTAIMYEENSAETLKMMREKQIVVEIPLVSNDFILQVRNNEHPIIAYLRHQVPIVLATDDMGVLRSDFTQEFVWAAMRYGLNYTMLKKLVYNSIRYSFLNENQKQKFIATLDKQFEDFEKSIITTF